MHDEAAVTTFLFTDIEGSTRLWEEEPERMRPALARHDAIARGAVTNHGGEVVKMTGDGIHAAFHDPLDAIRAMLELQQAIADPETTHGLALQVRCGMHAGTHDRRDDDFFGAAVNRAARIMAAAHGGQMLLSKAVADMLDGRLPEEVGLRDLGSVRLRDLGSPEQIFQLVHPQLRTEFPALRSLEETPNNLPHEITSFIGRELELARAGELLTQSRLLTVIGMGGLGKTRLALHVAAEAMDDYPDGVWFVELAPLRDHRGVAQAVASVLGVKEETGRTVAEALSKHVKDRKLLLVLDNCEHLLQGCAEVARQLLESGPGVKILASSREPLRIAGETIFPLAALAVPDLRAPFEPQVIAQSDAAQLFIERALAAQPDFQVAETDATAIAAICHRLDGIPLAIELAAARVRVLSVQQIAGRLTDRFKLLRGGDLTLLPRQQTLRALIDWSYDLLSGAERDLLEQLAVFAGGWTVEAAEAVCVCDEEDVVDLLGRLVDKSLVIRDPMSERYKLLETVRQYAHERLDKSGKGAEVRARHLAFHSSLAASAKEGMMGPEQSAWLARLDQERENILSSHAYADLVEGGAELGLKLASGIKHYWINRGLLEFGHRVTLEALARPGTARNLPRCRALFDLGQFRYFMGKYAEARECLEECLSIARELGDKRAVAVVLQPLGAAYLGEGNLATARRHLDEARMLAQERGDKRELSSVGSALGQLHRMEGKSQPAQALFEEVLEIAREQGDAESIAIGLVNLAMIAIGDGDRNRAGRMLAEALEIVSQLNSRRVGKSIIEVCAALASVEGEFLLGARLFGAVEALALITGLRRDPADEAFLTPLMAKARAALGEGAFAAAEAVGRSQPYGDAIEEARALLATYR